MIFIYTGWPAFIVELDLPYWNICDDSWATIKSYDTSSKEEAIVWTERIRRVIEIFLLLNKDFVVVEWHER